MQQLRKGDVLAWKTFYIAHRDIYIRYARIAVDDSVKGYQLIQSCFIELLEENYKELDFTSFSCFKKEVLNFVIKKCKMHYGERISLQPRKPQVV